MRSYIKLTTLELSCLVFLRKPKSELDIKKSLKISVDTFNPR